MRATRTAACLAGMAGLLGSVGSASAQTAFEWNAAVPGQWTDAARWSPMGSPGALSSEDTALLGLKDPYIVDFNTSRTLSGLSMENPDAVLVILPSRTLTIDGFADGNGLIQISNALSSQNATLSLTADSFLDASVRMVGFGLDNARLAGPTNMFDAATLGTQSIVTGRGTITGNWNIGGTIAASGSDEIVLAMTNGMLTGGGYVSENAGGVVRWNNHLATEITIEGEPSVNPGETLRVGPFVTFAAPMQVSNFASFADAVLAVQPFVELDATVDLRGFGIGNARLTGPAMPGNDAVLVADSVVTGNGTIEGYFRFEGLVTVANGRTIDLRHPGSVLTGGGVFEELDGDFVWNNHLVTGITLRGTPNVDPGETLRVGNAAVFEAPVRVSDRSSFTNANLDLIDGVTFNTDIQLEGFGPEDAQLRGPSGMGESAAIGPSSVVSGQGTLTGPLLIRGLVRPGALNTIDLQLANSTITGSGVIEELGEINWNNHLVTGITLRGALNIDPGETLRVGGGVTFEDQITVGSGDSFTNANLDVTNGVTFTTEIVLNGFGPEDAQLRGPTGMSETATLGAASVVTGQGTFTNALSFQGLVSVDSGRAMSFAMPGQLITGGGVLGQLGEFNWASHTVQNMTLRGALDVDQGETLFIGAGVTIEDPIAVGDGGSFTNANLVIRDGVALQGTVVLRGFGPEDARVGGTTAMGESATIGTNGIITGRGSIDGNTTQIDGVVSPGEGVFGFDTIELRTTGPLTFGPDATYQVGFAGPSAGEFDTLTNLGTLQLGGTLLVEALGGFEPQSTNSIEIITGGTITGEFDEIVYTGNLEAGDVARVFYDTNRVTFAVTCASDTTLPTGTLDIFDILVFLNTWNSQGTGADFNEDGSINIFDILDFLSAWNAGCPA